MALVQHMAIYNNTDGTELTACYILLMLCIPTRLMLFKVLNRLHIYANVCEISRGNIPNVSA